MVRMTRPSRRDVAAFSTAISAALSMVALAGCSRPVVSPIAPPPYRDEAAAGYDTTWRALVRALAGENVPLRVVPGSGVISTDDFISPIGVYADCGGSARCSSRAKPWAPSRSSCSRGATGPP